MLKCKTFIFYAGYFPAGVLHSRPCLLLLLLAKSSWAPWPFRSAGINRLQAQNGAGDSEALLTAVEKADTDRVRQLLLMSAGTGGHEQKLLGLDFDPSSIDQLRSIGYHITSHAGFSTSWVFVLTAGTGWKDQRYHLPGPWNEERRRWISDNLKAGCRITSLAGDEYGKDHAKDAWSVVMTQGTALAKQTPGTGAAWDDSWVQEQWKQAD